MLVVDSKQYYYKDVKILKMSGEREVLVEMGVSGNLPVKADDRMFMAKIIKYLQ